MRSTIEIQPDIAAKLAAQAQARGISIDAYLRSLVEEQEDTSVTSSPMTPAERAAAFRAWAESHKSDAPPLSDEAISRESIYTREDEQL